jgi:hypothetical protein
MDEEKIAMSILEGIALDGSRVLVERQRAIDALTLFHNSAIPFLMNVERKTDMVVLKERSRLYIQRIQEGASTSMTL